MIGRYRLYPHLWHAKMRFIIADITMLLWIVLWIYVGVKVHDAFWTLHSLADAIIATGTSVSTTGTRIDQVVTGVQSVASNLAPIELALRNALTAVLNLIAAPIDAIGKTLQTIGQQLTQALQGLQHDVDGLVWGVGSTLHTAIDPLIALSRTIVDLGSSVVSSGQDLHHKVAELQKTADTLPAVRAGITRAVSPLHSIPQGIVAIGHGAVTQGQQELAAIGNLALLMGILAAAVPVCLALWRYLSWRISATQSFHNLDSILLRQQNATAVATTMQVLAGRALYTLPYERLVQYTPDPIGEWHAGHYYHLARAALAEEGLDLERYLQHQQEGLKQ